MRARGWFFAALLSLPLLSQAAPLGYAINSDAAENADNLLQIDLATGEYTVIGKLQVPYVDTEGLALAEDRTLYAVDDNTDTLLTLSTNTGVAQPVSGEQGNLGISTPSGDYGLTFTCSGQLVMSSDQTRLAYRIDLANGRASQRSLSIDSGLTALATWGEQIYGVGVDGDENLYLLDPDSGELKRIGALGTPTFNDAGMAFDENGQLWLVTDGTVTSDSQVQYGPSKIYKVDTNTGHATFVAETAGGVESLAIAAATGCNRGPGATAIPALAPLNKILLSLLLALVAVGFLPRKAH